MNYQELNIALMESFGDLEQLCNQLYDDYHGVTCYIEHMEQLDDKGCRYVDDRDDCYQQLVHVRHKRNKLSHGEVSFSSQYAEKEDVLFVREFRESILNTTDPISRLRKALKAKKKNPAKRQTQANVQPQQSTSVVSLILCILAAIAFGIALLYFFYFK